MKKVLNPTVLQLALERAAIDVYQYEVVDPEMEDIIIGKDGEYETPEDWIKGKIKLWIEVVEKKFKTFRQAEKFEISDKTITTAYLFYKLKLGDVINIGKDVTVTRVPGGWIWASLGRPSPTTFIPYNDEFLSIIKGESK